MFAAPSLSSPSSSPHVFPPKCRLRLSSSPRLGAHPNAFHSHSACRGACLLPVDALVLRPCARDMRTCYTFKEDVPIHSQPLQQADSQDTNTANEDGINLNDEDNHTIMGSLVREPRKNIWVLVGAFITMSILLYRAVPEGYQLRSMVKFASLSFENVVPSFSIDGPSQLTLKIFGHKFSIGGQAPGWVYFILLMAAGFGLFVSEEALNVYVGASLARCLTWNVSTGAFFESLTRNAPYIVSTMLWVYWGVCISDMVPFYAGRITSKMKMGDNIARKLGLSKETLEQLSTKVQSYGDLIGFVERFSIGARNPTSFLAGALGVFPGRFFAGVCLGALFTVPAQLIVGCLLRERPVSALAGVAAVVGMWTVFPYVLAGLGSMTYLLLRWQKKA